MRYRIAAVAAALACLLAQNADAKDTVLRQGSSGPKVAALQWLLTGHRPNVFTKVKGTYPDNTRRGYWGPRTSRAVTAYKYRLGYPMHLVKPVAGPYFFALTLGRATRPLTWVALAQRRLQTVEPGVSPVAAKIKAGALRELGVTEHPYGSNCGVRVRWYQSFTGAYCAPWCASFDQAMFATYGPGTFANRSAGVLYIADWARRHSLLFAKPKVGSLVAYLDDGGHIGIVVKVLASGYVTVEGNSHNSVREVYHPWNHRLRVFINVPGV